MPLHNRILRTTRAAADVRSGQRAWYSIQNATADTARIDLYDEISFFGITANDFISELRGVTARSIDLHINSPGGDVFDGMAIKNALIQHPATVNVMVDGIAASIASVIATAGDRVEMARGAMMMIHEPFALVIGDSRDMRKMADALDKMRSSIADSYVDKAGGTQDEWYARMEAETWFTADEAVAVGLADAVTKNAAVKNIFDLSVFRNAPNPSAERTPEDQPATAEWQRTARLKVASQMEDLYAVA